MRNMLFAVLGVAALGLSACSKAPECTAEVLTKKGQEVATALQEAITKDPAKAAELSAKVQEVATKYTGATTSEEACKAYDDLLTAIKG
ncbi:MULTISPECIES: hypothetical protein [Aminobacter]|uniref:Lipoprotein n=2 Tax=Aminobacter TaxID=31988 RepID=A0AAC8YQC4_AMIAI|nr:MULTISPECIES: hypothetical protein [Aminobacter]AMS42356.1 hypothetical protein AA2016_3434 [Aminobacter aminovorans]MBA8909735.1 hypothetical protein [Aminobacter ciceronei]MBA9023507.1 hypothetical protein [Aminobacter ciceronei]MBB3709053.1 hypothetical protein [Aminobacter aminovorans]MRX32006.1 hypothetical protein [Aminobacter sp. MDW-2]